MSFKHGDGHVGAVVRNGEWFVTSPNMEFVPEPAVGRTCNMCIRANFDMGRRTHFSGRGCTLPLIAIWV